MVKYLQFKTSLLLQQIQPLIPLSQKEVSTILNQVPTTLVTQIVQQFPPDTHMLPVPPPDMITPKQYILQPDVTNN